MRFQIQIEQPLFFRGTRPFEGMARHASCFPPLPGTLYGMLRATLLRQNRVSFKAFAEGDLDEDLKSWVGSPQQFGKLRISAPRIYHEPTKTEYVPAPAHLVAAPKAGEDKKTKKIRGIVNCGLLSPSIRNSDFFMTGSQWCLSSPLKQELGLSGYWIASTVLSNMLQHPSEVQELEVGRDLIHPDDILISDNRTGIKLDDDTRTVELGKIYTLQMLALKSEFSLVLYCNLPQEYLSDQSIFLGGERRIAWLSKLDSLSLNQNQTGKVLIGVGPIVHRDGSWPKEVPVIASIVNGSVKISGYDIQKNRPKPLQLAANAGSVWFFEEAQSISITEENVAQGYGDFMTGDWK